MVMMSTPISETVLEFYKELPFNYRDSVEDHALSILENKTTYDVLTPFLTKSKNIRNRLWSWVVIKSYCIS